MDLMTLDADTIMYEVGSDCRLTLSCELSLRLPPWLPRTTVWAHPVDVTGQSLQQRPSAQVACDHRGLGIPSVADGKISDC